MLVVLLGLGLPVFFGGPSWRRMSRVVRSVYVHVAASPIGLKMARTMMFGHVAMPREAGLFSEVLAVALTNPFLMGSGLAAVLCGVVLTLWR